MIARLLSPSAESALFSADRLPEAMHALVLQEIMTPIVHSESMTPTLQKGDELRLQDADDLQVGDIVVYRHDRLFVCHRIHRIQGPKLFLRGDTNTGPFEDVDIRQVVGRVEALLRHGTYLAVRHGLPKGSRTQKDPTWVRTATWSFPLGRARALQFVNWMADRPVMRDSLRHILKRLITIDILEPGSLHSLRGYVARQPVQLTRLDQLQRHLSTLNSDDIILVIRAGPLYFGTCTLDPWNFHVRPLLRILITEILFESIRPFIPRRMSPRPFLDSTPDGKKQ